MADKIIPAKVKNMIDALNTFITKTTATCDELNSACNTCRQVLGSNDTAAQNLPANVAKIAERYKGLAEQARKLATAMEDDLNKHLKKETNIWNSDE